MGKKGSWFSAIKRVFTHSTKEKPINGSDKKNSKEKKKGKGILNKSETKSFIPLFREPSSIEKILGEADHLFLRPPTPYEQPTTPLTIIERPTSPEIVASPNVASPRVSSARVTSPKFNSSFAASSPKAVSSKAAPPRVITPGATSSRTNAPKIVQSRKEIDFVQRAEPTISTQHLSAIIIQSAYRGYVARRNFRALRGLVRLQGVVSGQNVKRQTANAMKQMQLLVRVQTQIQSRRIQMLESQDNKNDKEVETLSKWTQLSEAGNNENWDDSAHTKEEVEVRLRKKVEAVIKRERAVAYAYSNQLWKSNPRSAKSTLDIQSNGYPWWWNWLERQLPPTTTSQSQAVTKNVHLTPPRPTSNYKPSPQFHSNTNKPNNSTFDNQESLTPRSSKSSIPTKPKFFQTPSQTPPPRPSSSFARYSKPSTPISAYDIKDDDSLMSCPPFSVPNYMTPTVSAQAKARANSNPKDRFLSTPSNDSKRRFSFPMTPNIGSFKWNKGSNKETDSQKVLEKHKSTNSIGDLSIDSVVSMPAIGGRKPFNRYV